MARNRLAEGSMVAFRSAWLRRMGLATNLGSFDPFQAQLKILEGVRDIAEAANSFMSAADKAATCAIRSKGAERAAWRKMEGKFRKHAEEILAALDIK